MSTVPTGGVFPTLTLRFDATKLVRTVVIVGGEINLASIDKTNSFITVGSNSDGSLNTRCSDTGIVDGGVYNCNLSGEYFALIQENTNKQSVCELFIYSSYNIL